MTNVATNTNTNDIAATETSFLKAMGNGIAATAHLATLIHDASNTGDSRRIASVVNKLVTKGDANGSRVVRQVFAAIFTGAKFAKSKDKKTIVLKLKGVEIDADALARLDTAVSDNLSIRDALVKRVKNEAPKVTAMDTKMLNLVKVAKKEEMSKAAALAMFSAQWDASEKVN